MKAFISYSHHDTSILEILHKHLAQLQRDGAIQTWEDRVIPAGGGLDQQISEALETAQLFLALVSPDYLASHYCYEREFAKAMQMQEEGKLMIVPIIVEPCDWLNTPFGKFKALPKDGKAISTWENKNTAFLDVTQNLRKLVSSTGAKSVNQQTVQTPLSRNYRVQKDFDSIEKLEFLEKTFLEIKDLLKRYTHEVVQLENIKVRILINNENTFRAMLVNRNKIATEAELTVTIASDAQNMRGFFPSEEKQIHYSIAKTSHPVQKGFKLAFDEYQLFWIESNLYSGRNASNIFTAKEIAEAIWSEWLSSVGIL